jgi:hypothetical protein
MKNYYSAAMFRFPKKEIPEISEILNTITLEASLLGKIW